MASLKVRTRMLRNANHLFKNKCARLESWVMQHFAVGSVKSRLIWILTSLQKPGAKSGRMSEPGAWLAQGASIARVRARRAPMVWGALLNWSLGDAVRSVNATNRPTFQITWNSEAMCAD